MQFANVKSLMNIVRMSKKDIDHVMFLYVVEKSWHRLILASHTKHRCESNFGCRLLLASMLLQETMPAEEVFLLHWQRPLSLLGWRRIGNSPSKYFLFGTLLLGDLHLSFMDKSLTLRFLIEST